MGSGEASSSSAALPNKCFGKVQGTNMPHLKSLYPGKDSGELTRGLAFLWHASRGVTWILLCCQPPTWTGCCPRWPLAVLIGHTSLPCIKTLTMLPNSCQLTPCGSAGGLSPAMLEKESLFRACREAAGSRGQRAGSQRPELRPQHSHQLTSTGPVCLNFLSARVSFQY